ncbi:MAG: DUF3500 domain-containing protein [Acidobacteria bacterium]|nr:DUF3500 domain-containing protein [Acidobacteriota bacterium]
MFPGFMRLSLGTTRTLDTLVMICLGINAAAAQSTTSRIVGAANSFVSTLDERHRKGVLFAFDAEQQRARWSNLPVRVVSRAGLSNHVLDMIHPDVSGTASRSRACPDHPGRITRQLAGRRNHVACQRPTGSRWTFDDGRR